MSSRSRLVVLLISGPVIAFVLIGGALTNAAARDDTYQPLRMFQDVASLIVNNYVEKVNVGSVMGGAMRGLAFGLDPESAFLTPTEVHEAEADKPLPPAGVGVTLTRQYYLRVIAARPNSPAAHAGIITGDFIRDIDGRSTRELSVWEGRRALRGEAGTSVKLTIIRSNAGDLHNVTLVRTVEAPPGVTGHITSPGVGYMRIGGFENDITTAITHEVTTLKQQGATRLAIDLRGSSSGPLANGLKAARLFVASGTLGYRESRGAPRETISASAGDGSLKLPVVLMVDQGTAGAAELFAAALAGNHRAELVGERTDGLAAEQTLVKLSNGSGLWLSTTQYLTPSGAPIDDRGLIPDVAVGEPFYHFGDTPPAGDPILDKALALLSANHAA